MATSPLMQFTATGGSEKRQGLIQLIKQGCVLVLLLSGMKWRGSNSKYILLLSFQCCYKKYWTISEYVEQNCLTYGLSSYSKLVLAVRQTNSIANFLYKYFFAIDCSQIMLLFQEELRHNPCKVLPGSTSHFCHLIIHTLPAECYTLLRAFIFQRTLPQLCSQFPVRCCRNIDPNNRLV